MNDKKTAVITGGAGFIGSHLCDRLLEEGFKVICFDNLITGSLENIEHIKSKDFIFINHNITNYIDINNEVDCIFHFASPASPSEYLKFPIQTLKVGAMGTHNILGLAVAKRAKVLIASTSEVYGDPDIHPQVEEYWGNVNPIGPRGVYDEAKRFAEAITIAYHKQKGIDIRIARIFNTYGPRLKEHDGRAVPTFINQSLKEKEITIFGDGSQTRSFCYVSDTIEGIMKLFKSNYNLPVNIGNPKEMSVLELAKKIKEIAKSSSKIVFSELPVDDPKIRMPDISKAKKILGWQPEVSLDHGLLKVIDYFKKKLK